MLLSDRDICGRTNWSAGDHRRLVIDPFVSYKVREPGKLSWGLEPTGYTIRLGSEFQLITAGIGCDFIDPEDWHTYSVRDATTQMDGSYYILPGKSVLACSLERIEMPADVSALLGGKSTLARLGLSLNTTLLEAGWKGIITIEIFNSGAYPILLRPGMAIGQLKFEQAMSMPLTSYRGSYQDAAGAQGPRVVEEG